MATFQRKGFYPESWWRQSEHW